MSVPPRPTRRAVLVAGLLLPVAGCTRSGARPAQDSGLPGRPAEPGPVPAPAPDLRAAAGERERALIALYDEVLSAGTGDADVLRALREEHAAHLVALGLPAPAPAPAATASPAPRQRATAARVGLERAERRAAEQHARDAVAAPRELAGVLAQLAAAEDSHRVALA